MERVTKLYRAAAGSGQYIALTDVNFSVARGEYVAVVGKSGSGKSTLLNLITGLDRPTEGEVRVAGESLARLSEDRLATWRGANVGIVFQFFQLLPTLSVLENILIAMDFQGGVPRMERRERAHHLLERVGIGEQGDKLPATLSGGQQQRAAIARALANDPPLLVADEPTGNLDSRTAESLLGLFAELVAGGKTLIVVTHDDDLADRASRIIRLADGSIIEDRLSTEPRPAH